MVTIYILLVTMPLLNFLKVPVNGHKTVDGNIKVLPSKSDATMVTNVYRIGDTDPVFYGQVIRIACNIGR